MLNSQLQYEDEIRIVNLARQLLKNARERRMFWVFIQNSFCDPASRRPMPVMMRPETGREQSTAQNNQLRLPGSRVFQLTAKQSMPPMMYTAKDDRLVRILSPINLDVS